MNPRLTGDDAGRCGRSADLAVSPVDSWHAEVPSGDEFVRELLSELRREAFRPAAWHRFLQRSWQWSLRAIRMRPARAKSLSRWAALAGLLGLTVLLLAQLAVGWAEILLPALVWGGWYLAMAGVISLHLGMVRTPVGKPLDRLGIPNGLSFLRLTLAPLMWRPVMAVQGPGWGWIFLVFAITLASTDLVDGFLSRRFSMRTELGRLLDPMADVTFMVALAFGLYGQRVIPGVLLFLILVRYLGAFVGLVVLTFISGPVRVGATVIGKATTFSLSVGFLAAAAVTMVRPVWMTGSQSYWVVCCLTLLVCLNILYLAYRALTWSSLTRT